MNLSAVGRLGCFYFLAMNIGVYRSFQCNVFVPSRIDVKKWAYWIIRKLVLYCCYVLFCFKEVSMLFSKEAEPDNILNQ